MEKMRLDKILSNSGLGSRKEVKQIIKSGEVYVSKKRITDPGYLVDPDKENILVNGEPLYYKKFYYLMMNKPAGVITATRDLNAQTVIDLLSHPYDKFNLFPVGRLDKDTEGLLILTNDGKLAHQLLSPKKHVSKTYYAEVTGKVGNNDIQAFKQGIQLDKDYITLPAELKILEAADISRVIITVYEGKFHQIKRMFNALSKKVIYLKRLSMSSLKLDESLKPGSYRELTPSELESIIISSKENC
ncbi:MAG: pseudouridine synthase [Caldicoprobacterales bacterium]|jgi:16S rRNA pseudouridine516 synthase|nr:rRNA pseudouridine synthase [Clostridiales bacterium]